MKKIRLILLTLLGIVGSGYTSLTACESDTTVNVTVCEVDGYDFLGRQLTQSGIYYDTLTNVSGCDSIIELHLTVLTPLPYNCTFEDPAENAKWTFKNRINPGGVFTIGTATARTGQHSMYISNDNGVSAAYTDPSGGYVVIASREFRLAPGTYEFAFDWKSVGESGDAFRVAWVPSSVLASQLPDGAAGLGANFPNYITTNPVTGLSSAFMGASTWRMSIGTVTVPIGATESYQLVFAWKADGDGIKADPSACIDNVQLARKTSGCSAKPTNLDAVRNNTLINVSWQGSAQSYELEYYKDNDTVVKTVSTLSRNYVLSTDSLSEGIYNFRVRSICAGNSGYCSDNTSIWVEKSNVLVFDPSLHCLDYINFNASGVYATTGTYDGSTSIPNILDFTYSSIESYHTYHYIPGETDPRTNNKLKTKPDGAIASVRLGNWKGSDDGDLYKRSSIMYSFKVTEEIGVLLIKYAPVLDASGHSASDQPFVEVEILDSLGYILDPGAESCITAKFIAPTNGISVDGTDGWYLGAVTPNGTYYNWRDWSSVSLNLQQYMGRTISVRVSVTRCSATIHSGYAYITLDCSDGKAKSIKGDKLISCGEKPDSFVVDEGFKYRWYKKVDEPFKISNPSVVVSRTNVLRLTAQDTAVYYVDMMFPEDTTCYYTLEASALARLPKARMEVVPDLSCGINTISFVNKSGVFGYYEDPNNPGQQIEVRTNEKCDSYFWDFGAYGTSTAETPDPVTVPAEGDTIQVRLRVTMSGGCVDETEFTVIVPALKIETDVSATWNPHNCMNEINFNNLSAIFTHRLDSLGQWEPLVMDTTCLSYLWDFGIYGTSTDKTPSLTIPNTGDTIDVVLKAYLSNGNLEKDTTIRVEIPAIGTKQGTAQRYICEGDTAIFNGKKYTFPGLYKDTLKTVYGCDSVLTFTLDVLYKETVHRDTAICDDKSVDFFGRILTESGTYYHSIPSSLGCDSIDHVLELSTREVLKVSLGEYLSSVICGDDLSFTVPYDITWGGATGYKIIFDEKGYDAEFQDFELLQNNLPDGDLIINLPVSVRPDKYNATVLFYNSDCNNVEIAIPFEVIYPAGIVEQKWNDVLAVLNKNYNGGYTFSSFQWYKNGLPEPGETSSYLYLGEGKTFNLDDYYQVGLVRAGETEEILSCPIYPTLHQDIYYTTQVKSGETWVMTGLSASGLLKIWNSMGLLRATKEFNNGDISIQMPFAKGLYFIEIITDDGSKMTVKVIVN